MTYNGKRLASRLLSAHIVLSVSAYVAMAVLQSSGIDIYLAYQMIIQAYLFAGAINLWRIKELPTRFTDPPAEAPPHA